MHPAAFCSLGSRCFSELCLRRGSPVVSDSPKHLLVLLSSFFHFWDAVKRGRLQSSLPGTHQHLRMLPIPQPCSFLRLEISFFKSRSINGQDNEGGRIREGGFRTLHPHSVTSSSSASSTAATGGPQRASSPVCAGWSDKRNNRLDFPGPGFLSSLVLPGTSPPMPGALQNTFWNPPYSCICLPGAGGGRKDNFPLEPTAGNLQMAFCVEEKKSSVQRVHRASPCGRLNRNSSSHYDIGKLDELKQLTDEGAEFAPHIPRLTCPVAYISFWRVQLVDFGPILVNTKVQKDAVSAYTVVWIGRNGWNYNSVLEFSVHMRIQTEMHFMSDHDRIWLGMISRNIKHVMDLQSLA